MRLSTLIAQTGIAILMAVSLVLGANTAFADDRGDRRGGKFDNPGFNRHSDRGGRAHYGDRNERINQPRRRDYRRDNRFDSGSFFGGVVLGSLLSSNQSSANLFYTSNHRGSLHYGGHHGRPFDLRRRTGYRHSSYYSYIRPNIQRIRTHLWQRI
jgi:hypothetical protein